MVSNRDSQLGQLAIARGLVSLSELLQCVQQAGRSDKPLGDVLVLEGKLSNTELEELVERLDESTDAALQEELEHGKTIVLDELGKARQAPLNETLDSLEENTGVQPTVEMIAALDLDLEHEHRYDILEELGRGGMGQVLLARDLILNRKVALKTLVDDARTEKGRERLLLEAQVTGNLEHPSIVPVYDLRSLEEGEPFYTMRVVQERSLEQILDEIRDGSTEYSVSQLVSILRQVSLALQYAHDKGVVHRDVKPENILVGKYGEVFVIDWGIAKIVKSEMGLDTTERAVMGALVGTPQYMAPEQARGENETIDHRADVYALGAALYEILTLTPIFDADHVLSLLFLVVNEDVEAPSERAPDRAIPSELEEICLRALAKEPEDRYQSAEEFADEIELFLEGVKERERRQRMALDAMEQAHQVRAVYDEVRGNYAVLLDRLSTERRNIDTWASPQEKEELWTLEQQAEDVRVEIERRFGEAIRSYGQALVHIPEMQAARKALADLYWERFRQAEAASDSAQAAYFEGLLRQYNDGDYDELLEGNSRLSVIAEPSAAQTRLYRYESAKRRLVEWEVADLGETPIDDVSVSHGSYLLRMTSPGCVELRVPVQVGRVQDVRADVRMFAEGEVPDDFVVIPRGHFLSGGRTEFEVNAGRRRVYLDDFAIMRHPVTVEQYLAFLNDLVETDPERAAAHAPRIQEDSPPYLPRDDDGKFYLPDSDPEGDRWEVNWPIVMINFHDAVAYADWRSQREGRSYRLPSWPEWEKAARGADGRLYPWGDHFDSSFCRMRDSRKGRSTPDPVGTFEIDRSPYGLVDVAGNVAEWTSTPEPGSDDVMLLGGAAYNSIAVMCRLDFNLTSPSRFPYSHYGFRLAMSLAD